MRRLYRLNRATAGTYPSCQRCCAASAPHSGKTKGEGPCKHESSGKMRKVEVIADNLYLSHFPGYCVAGKESSTRKKDAERGRIARFSRSKRAEVGLCRQKRQQEPPQTQRMQETRGWAIQQRSTQRRKAARRTKPQGKVSESLESAMRKRVNGSSTSRRCAPLR